MRGQNPARPRIQGAEQWTGYVGASTWKRRRYACHWHAGYHVFTSCPALSHVFDRQERKSAWHLAAEAGHLEVLRALVHAVLTCREAHARLNSSLRCVCASHVHGMVTFGPGGFGQGVPAHMMTPCSADNADAIMPALTPSINNLPTRAAECSCWPAPQRCW